MMRSHNLSSICQTCLSLLALKEIAMLPWVFVRKITYLSFSCYPNHLHNPQFRNESSHLIIYRLKNPHIFPIEFDQYVIADCSILSKLAIRIYFTPLQLYEMESYCVNIRWEVRASSHFQRFKNLQETHFRIKKRSNVIVIGFQAKKKNRLSTFQYVTESSQHMSIFN